MRRRTGRYVRQLAGYSAFEPLPLPPEPPIEFDGEMRTLLSAADRALGRLDGSILALPNPELFVFMYVRKEAVLSSQIEGTQASLSDVLELEARLFGPARPDDTEETLNYVRALNLGLSRLQALPLSTRLLREIHAELMRGVRGHHATPGEFRTTQNWIGPQGASLASATFVPPPPHLLSGMLADLERYLHEEDDTPLLIRLGLIHVQFETLHPFLDGNGRMGRLLVTFLLCERGALIKPVLYLSHFFRMNREEYYSRLQAVRDKGDWEGWLKFFLTGVAAVSDEATETSRRIVQLREAHRGRLVETLGRGAANGLKLLEWMYQHPIFAVAAVARTLDISVQAANTLTERLTELGLIREMTGNRRNRVFIYDSYVSIFNDPPDR